jgi:hypothetical protein
VFYDLSCADPAVFTFQKILQNKCVFQRPHSKKQYITDAMSQFVAQCQNLFYSVLFKRQIDIYGSLRNSILLLNFYINEIN